MRESVSHAGTLSSSKSAPSSSGIHQGLPGKLVLACLHAPSSAPLCLRDWLGPVGLSSGFLDFQLCVATLSVDIGHSYICPVTPPPFHFVLLGWPASLTH